MKIRIKDNSVRLRLSQSEIRQLKELGKVVSTIQFSPYVYSTMTYRIVKSEAKHIKATFSNNRITISVPKAQIDEWANSSLVSIKYEKDISDSQVLRILIEKDFKCLTVRPSENEEDLFPHPKVNAHNC
ncbi:MAG: hypothetical protein AAFO07_05820 [Bacteroidota bacterium]